MRVGRRVRRAHGRARGTGPVRVVERTPTCFRLVTLEGHLEAGQIRFSRPRRRTAWSCSRSSRGRAARAASWTCSTTACAWPRRCSCTCGPRCSSASPSMAGGRVTARHRHPHAPRRGDRRCVASTSASRPCAAEPLNYDPDGAASARGGLAHRRLLRAAAARAARAAGGGRLVRGRADAAARLHGRRPEHRPRPLRPRRAARGARHAARAALPGLPHLRRLPRRRDHRRGARGRRPPGARLGLAVPDARGPRRAGRDVLGGVEVDRHRRGPVPHPLLLAADGRAESVHAARACG